MSPGTNGIFDNKHPFVLFPPSCLLHFFKPMRTVLSSTAVTAFATWYHHHNRDKVLVEQSLAHLTPRALRTLDDDRSWAKNNEEDGTTISKEERHTVWALAGIRQWMYGYLRKYAALEEYGPEQIKAALPYYTLPDHLCSKPWHTNDTASPGRGTRRWNI